MIVKSIEELVALSITKQTANEPWYAVFGKVSDNEAVLIKLKTGANVEDYERVIDNSAVLHTLKNHGDDKKEALRGQIAVVPDDFSKIPTIAKPENIIYTGKNKVGRQVFLYEKEIGAIYLYLEEVRTGRKHLALNTLYKRKPPAK